MADQTQPDPSSYWNQRYDERDQIWSGAVNASTAAVVSTLTPGRVLELGCGEGGDAVWFAAHGWRVVAVDISQTALDRGRAAASEAGLGDLIEWVQADLATWEPPGEFDLVTASFFHSRVELPRTEVLRRAAAHVTDGGHLLIVSHAAPPPWSAHHHEPEGNTDGGPGHQHLLASPAEEIAELDLPDSDWTVLLAETRSREAVGPDGQQATLDDLVILLAHTAANR